MLSSLNSLHYFNKEILKLNIPTQLSKFQHHLQNNFITIYLQTHRLQFLKIKIKMELKKTNQLLIIYSKYQTQKTGSMKLRLDIYKNYWFLQFIGKNLKYFNISKNTNKFPKDYFNTHTHDQLSILFSSCFAFKNNKLDSTLIQICNKKLVFLDNVSKAMLLEKDIERLIQKLENYLLIVQELVQKSQDRYDGHKYRLIVTHLFRKQTISQFYDILLLHLDNNWIVMNIIDIVNSILKFYVNEKNKFDNKNGEVQHQDEILSHPLIIESEVKMMMLSIAGRLQYKITEKTSQSNQISTVNFKVLTLYSYILSLEQEFFKKLISSELVIKIVKIMKIHAFNNILHNIIREIFKIGLRDHTNLFLFQKQCGFLLFLVEELNKKEKYEAGYKNQLYHLVNEIETIRKQQDQINTLLNQWSPWNQYIQTTFKQRRKTYKRLLGGQDPKVRSHNFLHDVDDEKIIECNFNEELLKQKEGEGTKVEQDLTKSQDENFEDVNLEIESDDEKNKKHNHHSSSSSSNSQDDVKIEQQLQVQINPNQLNKSQQTKLQNQNNINLQQNAYVQMIKKEQQTPSLPTNKNESEEIKMNYEVNKFWHPSLAYNLEQLMQEIQQSTD